MDFKNKSNNEILLHLQSLKQKHIVVKSDIAKLWSLMEGIEKEFADGNKVITERMGGDK
jgi:hypothetical protein